ncbi:PQQ-binding-like beta-propeller repeat protein [Paenibacillus sp. FSL R7-0297]|uniref:outer membrane protein assembly factor BamB family protein n=1 Tax=Paenibacillus sp. FSL R7-0297 TaxID=2921680 RepID=UPI0030FC44C5
MPPMKPLFTSLLALSLLSSLTAISSADLLPGTAYAASSNNTVTAISKDKLLPLKWQVATDGMGMYDVKPPVMNGILYYSDSNNTLYAKNIASGKIKWSYKQGAHPQIVTNNSVIFIDNQEQLVKVSAATGKLIWKVKVSERPIEIGAQARLINGKVYFANEYGVVAAYNPVTGKKLWDNMVIPMYAGTINGEYSGMFVVSSTVDNIRTQFYGLDPDTGKRLWRIEGLYSYVTYQNGQIILREQAKTAAGNTATAVPGYQLTLVQLNPATGKISGRENYNPLDDISRLGSAATSIQNSYVYTADGNLDQDGYTLTRFKRGADTYTAPTSYASFGNWLAGPVDGMAFFQHETVVSGINLASDSVVPFDQPADKIEHLRRVGKAVFAIYKNGYISINHSDTGALLGMINSGAKYPYFGNITIDHGTALIPTEHHILAVALPKEYQ